MNITSTKSLRLTKYLVIVSHLYNLAFKRGVYDIYGEYGLREGKLDTFGNLKGGYKYAGNAHQIFEKFFGTTNPFALNKDCIYIIIFR